MRKLRNINPEEVVFISLETEGKPPNKLTDAEKSAWLDKFSHKAKSDDYNFLEHFNDKSALYAEFATIKSVHTAHLRNGVLKVVEYTGDETFLLKKLNRDLSKFQKNNKSAKISGFAISSFSLPFLTKRSIINSVGTCQLIDQSEFKPWETEDTTLDLKRLWKSTGYSSVKLECLATALGVRFCNIDILPQSKIRCIADCFVRMSNGIEIKESRLSLPAELLELPLMQEIFETGIISSDNLAMIAQKFSKLNYEAKEKGITIIRSALLHNDNDLSPDIENILLTC